LTAASDFEPFTNALEFNHAPQVFHQNMLTKKMGGKPQVKAQPVSGNSASTLNLGGGSKANNGSNPAITAKK